MKLCNKDCKNCEVLLNENARMITFILNSLYEKFGSGVYSVVQNACPNLTCCYDCHIDDFCHFEDCTIEPMVKKLITLINAAQHAFDYLTDNLDNGGCKEIVIDDLRTALNGYPDRIKSPDGIQRKPCNICDKSEYIENYCFKCGRALVEHEPPAPVEPPTNCIVPCSRCRDYPKCNLSTKQYILTSNMY